MNPRLPAHAAAADPEPLPGPVAVAFTPGPSSAMLGRLTTSLSRQVRGRGHRWLALREAPADVLVTTARFGEPVGWREAPLFSGRRRRADGTPAPVFTLVHATPGRFQHALDAIARFLRAPARSVPFRGLTDRAAAVLRDQGARGGPMLVLSRVVQAQAKSVNVVLVVGGDAPVSVHHFDLVGGHRETAVAGGAFLDEIVQRIALAAVSRELDRHRVLPGRISARAWRALDGPGAMCRASREFGRRGFFSEMVRVADLVHAPAVDGALARHYSEGCFATWEPALDALLVTASGSRRAVRKGGIEERDLAVVAGVRPDGRGVLLRHVAGMDNPAPSSEAVELAGIDQALPSDRVPVVRSKLHGHRGVAAYDPAHVEYVALPPLALRHPPACGSDRQFRAVRAAFASSLALRRPGDARHVVFTVLPGHGVIIVEKWRAGAAPFQVIRECMDDGRLAVENRVPQGEPHYRPRGGRRVLA